MIIVLTEQVRQDVMIYSGISEPRSHYTVEDYNDLGHVTRPRHNRVDIYF